MTVDQSEALASEARDVDLDRAPVPGRVLAEVGHDDVAVQVGISFTGVGVVEDGPDPLLHPWRALVLTLDHAPEHLHHGADGVLVGGQDASSGVVA